MPTESTVTTNSHSKQLLMRYGADQYLQPTKVLNSSTV
jgi:hypothetical protein